MIPIGEQIACAERELALRRAAYPRFVANKRMTQDKADHEIAAMEAIVDTLKTYRDLWSTRREDGKQS
jgi:hypothetical protein